jgi:hypothetical protein
MARKGPGGLICAKRKVTPKKKASAPSKSIYISEGPPDEPLENDDEWPAGWIKQVYARRNGATKNKKDHYWYTPVMKFQLRSMVQVKLFLAALKDVNGDETKAKLTIEKA